MVFSTLGANKTNHKSLSFFKGAVAFVGFGRTASIGFVSFADLGPKQLHSANPAVKIRLTGQKCERSADNGTSTQESGDTQLACYGNNENHCNKRCHIPMCAVYIRCAEKTVQKANIEQII